MSIDERIHDQLRALCDNFRRKNPACAAWSDAEVTEACLIRLCETNPERVTKRKGPNGVLVFKILSLDVNEVTCNVGKA